jgi:hypothetical protein
MDVVLVGFIGATIFGGWRAGFIRSVHLLRDTTVPVVLNILGPLLPRDISTLLRAGPPALPGGLPPPTP